MCKFGGVFLEGSSRKDRVGMFSRTGKHVSKCSLKLGDFLMITVKTQERQMHARPSLCGEG